MGGWVLDKLCCCCYDIGGGFELCVGHECLLERGVHVIMLLEKRGVVWVILFEGGRKHGVLAFSTCHGER